MNPLTASAIEDMRLARSYLDDIQKSNGNLRSNITFATKHIEAARTKDPTARLPLSNSKDDQRSFSLDDLTGELLFFEAVSILADEPSEKDKRRVLEILTNSLKYQPRAIAYRSQLADLYIDLYDRESALATAREGVRLAPDDLNARKLLDRIEAAPETKPPSYFQRNPENLTVLGVLAAFAGGAGGILSLGNKFPAGLAFILFFGGLVAAGIGTLLDKEKMRRKFEADRIRQQNRR